MAIELGENLAKYAKNRFSSYDNFQIVNADFEKIIFFYDLYMQEFNYLKDNPNSKYNTVLKTINSFPDYLDYLPKGAITRKINIIKDYLDVKQQRDEFIFFSEHEFEEFVEGTSNLIYELLNDKYR